MPPSSHGSPSPPPSRPLDPASPRADALVAVAAPLPRRLTTMLRELAEGGRERVSVADMLACFGPRAYGALIFILAAPIAMPIPLPGLSLVLGMPLLLLTWQLSRGRRHPWLPRAVQARSLDRRQLASVIERLLPWLERAERLVRPRWRPLTDPPGDRLIGLLAFPLALLLFLPIPLGNMLPALALALLALGLLERDGVVVLGGVLVALLGVAVVSGALVAMAAAAMAMLGAVLGL
jgi:hypothetical protein